MGFKDWFSCQQKQATAIEKKLFSYRDKPMDESLLHLQKKQETKLPNPMPFVRINDLNNQNEKDDWDDNPPKRAVEIGLKFKF